MIAGMKSAQCYLRDRLNFCVFLFASIRGSYSCPFAVPFAFLREIFLACIRGSQPDSCRFAVKV